MVWCFMRGASVRRNAQIQPLGGGLRDIVPAPRGIRAVGDGAVWPPLFDRARLLVDNDGVPDWDAVLDEATALTGETGFIRSPLMQAGLGIAGDGIAGEGIAACIGVTACGTGTGAGAEDGG